MEEQFISDILALELKKLGFDEECFKYGLLGVSVLGTYKESGYLILPVKNSNLGETSVTIPLWQQSFDWFRKNHKLHVNIDEYDSNESWGYIINNKDLTEKYGFSTYEKARLACLENLILLVKVNQLIKQ